MNSLWPSRGGEQGTAKAAATATGKSEVDVADTGIPDIGPAPEPPSRPTPSLPVRPALIRNQISQPAPAPAPPAVPQPPNQSPSQNSTNQNGQNQQPPDSLTLAQLRRIVADLPPSEAPAYDFEYEDTGPLDEEIDEWFVYQFWQWARLDCAQAAFQREWTQEFGEGTRWQEVEPERRETLLREALKLIAAPSSSDEARRDAERVVLYIVLGRWVETADGPMAPTGLEKTKRRSVAGLSQLEAMKEGAALVTRLGGIPTVWKAMQDSFEPFWGDDAQQLSQAQLQDSQDELTNLMTIVYMMVQLTLSHPQDLSHTRSIFLTLNPGLADFALSATAKLRWDEAGLIPQSQMFLLFWKSLLLVFGGMKEISDAKKATAESPDGEKGKDSILASPLDYHVFRQEITSKYPAYIPPQAAITMEAEQTSLLPPLPNHPTRNTGSNGILPGPPNSQAGGASILHQPVHIATPAPSPPPSPAVGGKGGKKQNYQTNQNFPFMYPPLDATSNGAGGKGLAGLQDLLVGRKWEGSDVPASILEAGELFSKRVRTSRATRQLWDERERFLKFERGWEESDDDVIDDLDLSDLTLEEKEELGLAKPKEVKRESPTPEAEVDYGPRPEEVADDVKDRLKRLEVFYKNSLPHLQSVVIVLLKAILLNNAILMVQSPPGQQHAANNPRANGQQAANRSSEGIGASNGANDGEPAESTLEEMDFVRTREIVSKSVSGILLLLLKWMKISQILKFEYLTQLLLDCNYVPLFLKLWAHWDIQQLVDWKSDKVEHSFFYFCNARAGITEAEESLNEKHGNNDVAEEEEEEEAESEDEAVPPPIRRRPSPPEPPPEEQETSETVEQSEETRPEVDELGYPVNPLPKEPITDFNRRNFFSLINLLRIMQKICKNKAHRNLLLVHYKSSNILRKMLKVPQEELRLYTLKLFKNQVPYCGRKWRQGNMRVITAVYLHCRPELRDEWLAGSDVDAEVEEALPLEQALRSLTHWYNVRRYPDKVGSSGEAGAALKEERGFFVRELEKIDLVWDAGDGESVMSEWEGMPGG